MGTATIQDAQTIQQSAKIRWELFKRNSPLGRLRLIMSFEPPNVSMESHGERSVLMFNPQESRARAQCAKADETNPCPSVAFFRALGRARMQLDAPTKTLRQPLQDRPIGICDAEFKSVITPQNPDADRALTVDEASDVGARCRREAETHPFPRADDRLFLAHALAAVVVQLVAADPVDSECCRGFPPTAAGASFLVQHRQYRRLIPACNVVGSTAFAAPRAQSIAAKPITRKCDHGLFGLALRATLHMFHKPYYTMNKVP